MVKDCYKVVILSRGRWDTITSHDLFPYADLVVPTSEKEKYKHTGNKIVTIPDKIEGLGGVRNWVLENYDEECIIMVDDDIKQLALVSGVQHKMINDVEYIKQVLENTYICAKDIGAKLFGFSQTIDLRKYKPYKPFSLNSWVGGVVGVIGRKYKFINNKLKVDIDFYLQNVLIDRIVFVDLRYSFIQHRYKNKGGNSLYRTEEQVKKELEVLKNKWGKYFNYSLTKTTEKTSVNVKRKQILYL
mgnify:FL=1